MTTQSLAALQRAIRSAAKVPATELTDRDLLKRFAEDGDEAAFTALVTRHTGMVIGVCRRLLPTLQDAEDACQATFLVLARKAGSGRWQPSVANWLYTTARRVAAKARLSAQRRARREGRAAVSEAVEPVDRMTGRELLAALDDELDRLTPAYREALVLCYLEGLSRDEAAVRLGVPSATLKSRLERGRKKLGDALTRRGVVAGAGLLILAVTSPAGASPPRLVQAILATVSGPPPAAVAELVKGVAVNGMMNKAVVVLVALVGVVALGIGLASPGAGEPPPDKPAPLKGQAKDEKPTPEAPKEVAISGRVLDPDGKPVTGATFAVIADESGTPIPKVTTSTDGRFAFSMSPPPEGRNPRQVVASAPGFGVDWVLEPRADAVFRLVPDLPITGRVIDLQGKPVAGAKVEIRDIHAGPPGAFDELVQNWKKSAKDQEQAARKLDRFIWNRGGLGQAFHTTTAKDGTFTLSGFGKDRVVTLLVSGPGIADTFAAVATRTGFDPVGAPLTPSRLYGPNLSLVVDPDKPVTGVVRDAATKAPLPGVRVTGTALTDIRFGAFLFHAWPTPVTTTDKEGRFTLSGMAKAKAYIIVADPEVGTEHLHRFGYVEDTIGFAPVTTGLDLPRGVVLSGRVTNAVTGDGVPSRVFYRPLEKNELLGQFDGYGPPDLPAPWYRGWDIQTDLSGRYKLTVMPGAGVVNFQTFSHEGTTVGYDKARATKQDIDDGIVDAQFGHFRALGQGGMFKPESMNAFRVIGPPATDRTMTLDVTVRREAK